MSENTDRQEIPDHEPSQAALDREGEGPKSIAGLEASQLPDGGRTTPDGEPAAESDIHHDLSRKTPAETGGVVTEDGRSDVGMRGTPEIADLHDNANESGGPAGSAL